MDTRHRRLYMQWCQSERVELFVGGLLGPTERFLIPRELLRRRSRTFYELLEQHAGDGSPEVFQLPDTPVQTLQDFFMWTFSPQPQIDDQATFTEIVRLGIFAWRYQISALSNQATDMIRSNLANGGWQLQAWMVDDIYDATPTGSPLREVIRAALGQLPRSTMETEGQVREEWKATFLKHAQLGWDYIEARGSEWLLQDSLSNVCRFHDHQGVSRKEDVVVFYDGCPYAREDCYPSWEEEESTKGLKDKEQERSGLDKEMIRKEGGLSNEAAINGVEGLGASKEVMEEVNGTVTSEEVVDEVSRTITSEEAVGEGNGTAVSEQVVDEVNGAMTSEEVADKVSWTMASEEAVDEGNGTVVSEQMREEVNGTVTSEEVADEVSWTMASEEAVDEGNGTVVSEQVVDKVNGVVTSEEVVDKLNGTMVSEEVVDEVNRTVSEELVDEVNGTVTPEEAVDGVDRSVMSDEAVDGVDMSVVSDEAVDGVDRSVVPEEAVDGVDRSVALEAVGVITEEKMGKSLIEKVIMDPKIPKTGGKKNRKKRKGSVVHS